MRQTFVKLAGEHPRGWDDLWAAFVAVIRGGMTDNNLEASLAVGAFWAPVVDVGPEIITITGRGPSSYEHDPNQSVDELVAQVDKHPVVAVLRDADANLHRWVAEYQPPEELD